MTELSVSYSQSRTQLIIYDVFSESSGGKHPRKQM